MRLSPSLAIAAATISLFAANAAQANPDDARVKALEQKVDAIQDTYLRNNQQIASSLARSHAIESEFTQLKGQIETNKHLIEQQHGDLLRQITGLDHRIQAIEDRMAIFSSQLSKALGTVSPDVAKEGELYQKGLDLVDKAKYLEAAAVFQKFLKQYPKSQFVPNARYWIGECTYSVRDLQQSIKAFQTFVEKHPRNPKVPEAILRQGDAFNELGMPDEARAFYQKVIQSYPKNAAAERARAKIKRLDERKAAAAGTPPGLGSYPNETLDQRRQRLRGTVEKAAEANDAESLGGVPARDF